MVKDCTQCGSPVDASAKFCSECGFQLRKPCIACKSLIDLTAKHCPDCGVAQGAGQPVPAGPDRMETRPGAEYRQVTVMFLDLVGSTALSGRFDVEDWRELLLAFQAACVEAIERFGGRVGCYMGDGMMVTFGLPLALEDAPKRAAYAGLAILEGLEKLNRHLRETKDVELKVRIGIHVGRVVAGEMGAGETRDSLDIVGVTPSLAARLESAAPTNGILVSGDLKLRIEDEFELEALGSKALKGIEGPVEVFLLLAPKAQSASSGSALPSGTQLTGRQKEVEALMVCWQASAESGSVKLATIEGEPGAGKSGLLQLFLDRARIPAADRLVLACSAYDRDTPFAPLRDRLAEQFGLRSSDSLDEVRRKLREGLGAGNIAESDREEPDPVELVAPLLLTREGAGPDDRECEQSDSLSARRDLFRALTLCLKRQSEPLLLVLEDAHWADPSTIELIDRMLRQPDEGSVMVLVLTRPTGPFPWHNLDQHRIMLTGLTATDCEALVRHLSGGLRLERTLFERIVAITDGIPLFVKELTKSILESDQITRRRDRLGLIDETSDIAAPGSLLDLLTARLDQLGLARETAQTAAVIGRDFSSEALRFMSGRADASVAAHLSDLVRCDMISKIGDGPASRYQFHHALYQKVAYDSLLRRDRRRLHDAYLDWLESNPIAKMSVRLEQRAFHNERAGRLDEAVALWTEAGETATSASASQEAVRHFESGLRILRDLPSSAETQAKMLHLTVLLGGAQMMSKGPGAPETHRAYDQALQLCEALPETPWHFPAYWGWWRVSENFTVMLSRAQRLVSLAEDMKEPECRLQAHHCLWVNAYMVGDHARCLQHAEHGLRIYQEGSFDRSGSLYGGHDPKVCGLGETALSLWLTGRPIRR